MTEIIFTTERLVVSPLSLEDAPFIYTLLNEPAFLRFIGDRGARDLDGARAYLFNGPLSSYQNHGFGLWRVSLAANGQPIGICGLIRRNTLPDVDLGYAYLSGFWGQGYASEAATGVRDYANTKLGLKRLLAITDQENIGSIRVLEKIGMRREGLIRMPGEDKDLNLFSIEF